METTNNISLVNAVRVLMRNGIAHFTFRKVDGSVREAYGTLKSSLVKAHVKGTGSSSPKVVAFIDVEKGEWRCFKPETLIEVLD